MWIHINMDTLQSRFSLTVSFLPNHMIIIYVRKYASAPIPQPIPSRVKVNAFAAPSFPEGLCPHPLSLPISITQSVQPLPPVQVVYLCSVKLGKNWECHSVELLRVNSKQWIKGINLPYGGWATLNWTMYHWSMFEELYKAKSKSILQVFCFLLFAHFFCFYKMTSNLIILACLKGNKVIVTIILIPILQLILETADNLFVMLFNVCLFVCLFI